MRNEKGQFIKGIIPHNKGVIGFRHSHESKKKISIGLMGRPVSLLTRKKMSETHKKIGNRPPSQKGKKRSLETIKKIKDSRKGYRATLSTRLKMSKSMMGKNSKGEISITNTKLRNSLKFRLWRERLFKRDNWTCQECNTRSGNGKRIELHAHHILPFAYYPELRFELSNGQTLCIDCHRKTLTYAGKSKLLI